MFKSSHFRWGVSPTLCNCTFTVAVPHLLCPFNVPLFVPLPYFIRARFVILTLLGINLNIDKATFLSLVKTACSTAAFFQVFLCQYVYKLTIWNVVDVLALFSIRRSHCGRISPSCNYVSHRSILLAFIFILLFSHVVAITVSPLLFLLFGLPCRYSLISAIFNSSLHFYCHAIFIAAVHFIAVQPAISRLFIQGWTLSCHFCSGLSLPYSFCC